MMPCQTLRPDPQSLFLPKAQRVISVIKTRVGDISIASCLKTLIGEAVCLDDFPVRDRRLRSLPAFRRGGIYDALPDIET